MSSDFQSLTAQIQACSICQQQLPFPPKPVLQVHTEAKILIAGQAPGLKVQHSGIAFNDKSGERLRSWLGVSHQQFYNPKLFAIVPMGFCYPGKGKSGDLPPRKECANTWRDKLLASLTQLQLIIAIGQYAQQWHIKDDRRQLTEKVKNWSSYIQQTPAVFPIVHPSPRNNIWLKKNPWFEQQLIPQLQHCVKNILNT